MTRIQITLDKCYSCDCDPGEFNWTTQEDHDTEIAELLNVELEGDEFVSDEPTEIDLAGRTKAIAKEGITPKEYERQVAVRGGGWHLGGFDPNRVTTKRWNERVEDGKRRAEQKQKDWERYSIEVSEKEFAELQAQRSAYLRAQSNFNAFCNTLKTRQTTPDRERY